MNSLEKLQVLLQHWIEHNHGHLHDFEKWQKTMSDEGQPILAEKLQGVMTKSNEINTLLQEALAEAGGPLENPGHHHHHHH